MTSPSPSPSPTPILIPLINPNEPEALLAALHVHEGQRVSAGDLLGTLETTKSTADLSAEADGYIVGLQFKQGDTLKAGERLCYLSDTQEWSQPEPGAASPGSERQAEVPAGLRISKPALALALRNQVDLSLLPTGPLVTESIVRAYLEKRASPDYSPPQAEFDPTAILVYGGGGHGKALIELLRALGTYRIAGVLDDNLTAGGSILGAPVLGGGEILPDLRAGGVRLAVNAVGGIGNIGVRVQVFRRLEAAGFICPPVIHPTAYLEPSARISGGVQVFPHAYVGSDALVGFGVILNTGSIVSHDCVLGDYANISPGAMLAGAVQIGSGVLVGMGVTINLEAKVGAGARIGNGATVKADVPERGVVRAGTLWPE